MTELETLLLEQLEKTSTTQQKQISELAQQIERLTQAFSTQEKIQQQQIQVLTAQVQTLAQEWMQREQQIISFLSSSAQLELHLTQLEKQQSKR